MKIKLFERAYPKYGKGSKTETEKLLGGHMTPRKMANVYIYQEFTLPEYLYDGLEDALCDDPTPRFYTLDLLDLGNPGKSVDFMLAYRHGRLGGVCLNTKELVLFKRESSYNVINLTGDRLRDLF